ncbi:hypothetical protein [Bacillus sp. 2205SS5-2]
MTEIREKEKQEIYFLQEKKEELVILKRKLSDAENEYYLNLALEL